jgi:hypothetical protein
MDFLALTGCWRQSVPRQVRLCNVIQENGNLAKLGSYPSSLSSHFQEFRCKAAKYQEGTDGVFNFGRSNGQGTSRSPPITANHAFLAYLR